MRAYIPESSLHPDALQRFGEVVRDFINTYEFNIGKRPGLGRFERIVIADDGLTRRPDAGFDTLS